MRTNMKEYPARNQYLTVLLVNIVSLCQGKDAGWISPALLILDSEGTPLKAGPLTTEQISWLASALPLGALLGVITSGTITNRYGTRVALIFLSLPQIIWWGLVAYGGTYHALVIGRVFVGYSGGSIFRVIPHFVAEIAQKEIRGTLGSISELALNAGNLLGFILGKYVPYHLLPCTAIVPALYIVLILIFIPETPPHLLKQGECEKAYKSLMFYRTTTRRMSYADTFQNEFTDYESMQKLLRQKGKASWKTWFTKDIRFGLSMALFLAVFSQCTGFFLLMQFTATIFEETGSIFEANRSAILVSSTLLIGNGILIFFVDRVGRKILLLISSFGASVTLSVFGTYSFLEKYNLYVCGHSWIPLVMFAMTILLLSLGVSSVPFVILAEILPAEVRSFGLTMANIAIPVTRFILMKTFPQLMEKIQIYGILWILAAFCLIGMLVSAMFLPETKGKNLNKV